MTRLFVNRTDKTLVEAVKRRRETLRIATAGEDFTVAKRPMKVRLSSRGETYHTEASLYRTVAAHRALAREKGL